MTARMDNRQELEKLLLINLHESFYNHKADFTGAFNLLQSYLDAEDQATEIPILST